MPVDTSKATEVWNRYCWARDNGHAQYVEKADACDAMFRGDQWREEDKIILRQARRPALTVNKILPTIANVMGEQIYNRAEIGFQPRSGAPEGIARALAKVFKQISDNTQLDWKRSDMFADGVITSRGFLDARIKFDDSMQGEVAIELLNPKNVIVDPDAEAYDPDTWSEVFTTKWVTADDIAVLYNRADADYLRNRGSYFPYGYDSIEANRDRFGERFTVGYDQAGTSPNVTRNIRLIERQYRKLDRQKHFVVPDTGDTRPVPEDWSRDKIAFYVDKIGFKVIEKPVRRIRWIVIADSVVLHDEWSPYDHFTVVPFFPYFRHGQTIGLVENLMGSQEMLNKVLSQELHVVNTTANSGWKVKAGALTNMSIQELEQRGGETGLVVEVNEIDGLEKITPNAYPTGLDRASYKAEEHIKGISGVSDSMQGFDREDVAAKAIQAKRQAGTTNLAKPLDSLTRSDHILARNVLCLVQKFYTESRLLTITKDKITGESETVGINQPTPEGLIVNDLTLGEYDVVVTSVPQRETLEDSQFEQAMALREAGIMLPDDVLIASSRLLDKKEIIEKMAAQANSPEAQAAKQLQTAGAQAEVAKTQAETRQKEADAVLKQAKAQETGVKAQKDAMTPIEQEQGDGGAALAKTAADIDLQEREFEHQKQLDFAKLSMERQKQKDETWIKAKDQADKAASDRIAAVAAANNPQPQPTSQGN
ncbi:MAG: genomic island protein [Proteobacteria bacterium]|nr:genomic island protein [Pseudomonadota bacterium]